MCRLEVPNYLYAQQFHAKLCRITFATTVSPHARRQAAWEKPKDLPAAMVAAPVDVDERLERLRGAFALRKVRAAFGAPPPQGAGRGASRSVTGRSKADACAQHDLQRQHTTYRKHISSLLLMLSIGKSFQYSKPGP